MWPVLSALQFWWENRFQPASRYIQCDPSESSLTGASHRVKVVSHVAIAVFVEIGVRPSAKQWQAAAIQKSQESQCVTVW